MSQSESNSDKSSASRSPESVLSKGPLKGLVEKRVRREAEGLTPYPEEVITQAESNLRFFQSQCTGLAFGDLMALMNGGTGTLDGLYHDDALLMQGKIDLEALQLLYGVMLYAGEDPEDAARLTYIYYDHCCEQDDDHRIFAVWPEGYRRDRLRRAISGFEKGAWNRWCRRDNPDGFDEEDYENWTGDYSETTYDTIRALVHIACTEFDPEYIIYDQFELDYDPSSEPIVNLANGEWSEYSKRTESIPKIGGGSNSPHYRDSARYRFAPTEAIVNVAMELDGRSKSTYQNAIQRLRKNGFLKWAEITEGVDYRLYLNSMPDPGEANRIKFEGEEYVPETMPGEDAKQEILTDGGTRMNSSEAKRDIERVRQVRAENTEPTEEPELHRCPIEGCTRIVIDNPSGLRSHVRQAGDGAHEGRILTENLEVEVDEESYHANWGPGVRDGPPPEQESIYAEYEGEWGPGALKSEIQS